MRGIKGGAHVSDGIATRVAFTTLGCKVNQYDTEAMTALFRRRGYAVVDFHDAADVYVINTCTVTERGAAKSWQLTATVPGDGLLSQA